MYHYLAFRWGIIQGNAKEDITPWMCNKHINCTYDAKKPIIPFEIAIRDQWPDLGIQFIQITNEFLESNSLDLLDIWRYMISIGCYPRGAYNEQHIPAKIAYQRFYFSHDYLLIGYDDDEKVFHSVAYLPDNKFQRFTIPYENMRNAILSHRNTVKYLEFLSYKPINGFKLELEGIVRDLEEYITSTTSIPMATENVQFGMEAIRSLKDRFEETAETNGIDFRFTRGLMEHKFLMKTRTEYMNKEGYFSNQEIVEKADTVYKISEKVHLLGLKFNMTANKNVLNSLTQKIDDMLALEKEYLPEFLECLKQYKGAQHE